MVKNSGMLFNVVVVVDIASILIFWLVPIIISSHLKFVMQSPQLLFEPVIV
eukprot:c31960_g1_i1 orf=59-211(+)